MSTSRSTRFGVGGCTEYQKAQSGASLTVDGTGTLVLPDNQGAAFVTIAAGQVVRGIRIVNGGGTPDHVAMIMIRSSTTAPVTIVHADLGVAAADQIFVSDGEDTQIDNKPVQVFYDIDAEVWLVSDWADFTPPP